MLKNKLSTMVNFVHFAFAISIKLFFFLVSTFGLVEKCCILAFNMLLCVVGYVYIVWEKLSHSIFKLEIWMKEMTISFSFWCFF